MDISYKNLKGIFLSLICSLLLINFIINYVSQDSIKKIFNIIELCILTLLIPVSIWLISRFSIKIYTKIILYASIFCLAIIAVCTGIEIFTQDSLIEQKLMLSRILAVLLCLAAVVTTFIDKNRTSS